jgi:hypothetical protein
VAYISSIERSGIEKGIEEGIEKGRQEGILAVVLNFFEQKFPSLPSSVRERLTALDAPQMEELSQLLAGFSSIPKRLDPNRHRPQRTRAMALLPLWSPMLFP